MTVFGNCYPSPSPFYYFRKSSKRLLQMERHCSCTIAPSLHPKAAPKRPPTTKFDQFCEFKIGAVTPPLRHVERYVDSWDTVPSAHGIIIEKHYPCASQTAPGCCLHPRAPRGAGDSGVPLKMRCHSAHNFLDARVL